MKRRIARFLLLCIVAAPCTGCVWLQNEFFVFDAPPPVEQPHGHTPDSGTDALW